MDFIRQVRLIMQQSDDVLTYGLLQNKLENHVCVVSQINGVDDTPVHELIEIVKSIVIWGKVTLVCPQHTPPLYSFLLILT